MYSWWTISLCSSLTGFRHLRCTRTRLAEGCVITPTLGFSSMLRKFQALNQNERLYGSELMQNKIPKDETGSTVFVYIYMPRSDVLSAVCTKVHNCGRDKIRG